MIGAREVHTATLLPDGRVLVAAGSLNPDANGNALSSAELYNPAGGNWTPINPLSNARAWATATLLPDGKVLVAGGGTAGGVAGTAELYNWTSGTWTNTGGLNTARGAHTATLLPNGKVLITGGQDVSGAVFASVEVYDPTTGAWATNGALTYARRAHTATLLTNSPLRFYRLRSP